MISAKKLMARKLQRMAALGRRRLSLPRRTTDGDSISAAPFVADKGHFEIYTADKRRFMVPLEYLYNDLIQELFKISEDEFGFSSGGLFKISEGSIPFCLYCKYCAPFGLNCLLEKIFGGLNAKLLLVRPVDEARLKVGRSLGHELELNRGMSNFTPWLLLLHNEFGSLRTFMAAIQPLAVEEVQTEFL